MMRSYLDRMLRRQPRDLEFTFRDGMLITSDELSQADIHDLRSYMAKKPDLVDGQLVTLPRSRDRTSPKFW